MTDNRFDTISKLFAERRLSRRKAVTGGAVGVAGLATAGLGVTFAQDATPAAEPPSFDTTDSGEKVQYLFVQSYTSGSVARTDVPGRYTVTLEGGAGQTVYFADRPSRDVGVSPTDQFLEGLGFDPENPPNAALVLEVEPGDQDIAVVELFNPTIDADTNTVTYDVTPLANWDQSLEMGFQEAPTDLADLVPEFGAAHVFIDDCADHEIICRHQDTGEKRVLGQRGFCYSFPKCWPCRPDEYRAECEHAFPEFCQGRCDIRYECHIANDWGDFCI